MARLVKSLAVSLLAVALAASVTEASQRTFPAGSYIIPMDTVYQPEADGGIFEAYGMVFDILQNGGTAYWIIDETKTSISAPDITIYNTITTPVASHFGGAAITGITTTIQYSGAPWVIVPGEGLNQADIEAILNHSDWSAVNKHISNVPFTANVSRELTGTPPQVALLNNMESTTSGTGNAQILESYLSLAGICNDTYTIVTPNNVRDGALDSGIYTVFWAPHWTAYDGWTGGSATDADAIMGKIRDYLEAGNSLFAECASIEVMEHNAPDRGKTPFLTSKGFSHDGGTMDPARIIYNDTTSPFPQVGDYTYTPTGGHLHNWRPWMSSNYDAVNNTGGESYPTSPAYWLPTPTVTSSYNATVSRFTHDDKDGNLATPLDQWDYYVGGRLDGIETNGYVVYLGGHKYSQCNTGGSGTTSGPVNEKVWEFDFKKNMSSETMTITVNYTYEGSPQSTTAVVTSGTLTTVSVGNPLELDFGDAIWTNDDIRNVYVRNLGTSAITVNTLTLSWTGGAADQKTDNLYDKTTSSTITLYNAEYVSPRTFTISSYTIENSPPEGAAGGAIGGCVNNSGCTWTSVAGVRYVLNTLFNLQFTVVDTTYIRSAPVVMDTILYQGTFDYPSYGGHIKAYNVENVNTDPIWDGASNMPAAASRTVYTTVNKTDMIPFTTGELSTNASFQTALNLTAAYADSTTTYNNIVNRIRGVDIATGTDKANRLGAVEHSAAAVVKPFDRSNGNRPTMVYFGTLDGILEAFNVSALHANPASPTAHDSDASTELWGFIPKGQLGSLKNSRGQPDSIQPYPGVDTSPTVAEVFYDHDADPDTNNWRTILAAMTGKYGASPSVFAIDVTDPTNPDLLWEKTQEDIAELGGGMRVSIGMVKNAYGVTVPMVFAATNKVVDTAAIPAEAGGIRMFGFDLATGNMTWSVSEDYAGSQNDLPGAITLVDTDRDGYVDVVLAGDMDGRLWELNALTGANANGAHIPLFNGGAGATVTGAGVNYPIAASPTVTIGSNGHVLVVFGTGGTDWAPADADHLHSIFVIDMTQKLASPDTANGAATLLWQLQLEVGEKAWSSPTVADGTVYVSTAYGTMESANPGDDIASTAQLGKIRAVSLEGGETVFSQEVGNQRGSVYIKDGHAYGSTLDGRVVQLGDEDFSSGFVVNVFKLLWKENP